MTDTDDEDGAVCAYCGGPIAIRNPTGNCDHLYFPECLSDDAKIANGFKQYLVAVWAK